MIPMNLIVREWVALASAVSLTCVVAMFLWNLAPRLRRPGFYAKPEVRGSIALSVLLTGQALRLDWVWPLLRGFVRPGQFAAAPELWMVDIVAGVITVIGSMCVVRELAREPYGNLFALLTAGAVVVITLGAHLF